MHRRLGGWVGALSVVALAALGAACTTEGSAEPRAGAVSAPRDTAVARPGSGAAASAGPLERGLGAIDAGLIAQDVGFLACDELEGRDTPSAGLRIAARYIVNRLERAGLRPGAESGWYHLWPMAERRLTGEDSSVALVFEEPAAGAEGPRELPLAYGTEWAVHPTELVDASLEAPLVWCGDGSRSAFRELELDGVVAVCLEGDESRARRRKRARDAGAVGLLVLREPLAPSQGPSEDGEADGAEDPFETWVERLAKPVHIQPRDTSGRLPVLWLQGAPAARLAELGGALEPGAALPVTARIDVTGTREVLIENVCGYWPGRDPELEDEVILVSAHYDHVGVRRGEIYNGADDNASGSAALLALAEALAAHGPLERSVLLLWVSGEEKGLLGSAAWSREPWLPDGGRPLCNINFDMVGRNAAGMLEYTPTPEHAAYNGLSERVVRLAALEGFDDLRSADKDFSRSDHASFFKRLDIPVVYVSAGEHPDYHEPTDTADKIDSDKVARFTRLVFRLITELQDADLSLERFADGPAATAGSAEQPAPPATDR